MAHNIIKFSVTVKSPSAITVPREVRAALTPHINGKLKATVVEGIATMEDKSAKGFDVKVGHYAAQLYPDSDCGSEFYAFLVQLYGKKVTVYVAGGNDR